MKKLYFKKCLEQLEISSRHKYAIEIPRNRLESRVDRYERWKYNQSQNIRNLQKEWFKKNQQITYFSRLKTFQKVKLN